MHKVVSLFAGCGGAECGLLGGFIFNNNEYKKLPYELVYAVDIDKKALDSHRLNFGCSNTVLSDIRDVCEHSIPNHDVLIGGFPCQSFSIEGRKEGFSDKDGRGMLFFDFIDICAIHKPKVIFAGDTMTDRRTQRTVAPEAKLAVLIGVTTLLLKNRGDPAVLFNGVLDQ